MRYTKRVARKYDIQEFNNSGTPCGVIVKEGMSVAIFRGPHDPFNWVTENYSPFKWGIIALPNDQEQKQKTIDDITGCADRDIFTAEKDSTIVPVTDGLIIYEGVPVLGADNKPCEGGWQKMYGNYKFHYSDQDWREKKAPDRNYITQTAVQKGMVLHIPEQCDCIKVEDGYAKFFKGIPSWDKNSWYEVPKQAASVVFPTYRKKNPGKPIFARNPKN